MPGLENAVSERVRVRRHPERGGYEPAVIRQILDEAYICHVGLVAGGHPLVLPTVHVRVDDRVYLHGAAANAMFAAAVGREVCVTATIIDGLVMARAVYDHSMNYRSVVVLGIAEDVTEPAEKRMALRELVEHVVRGRSQDAREASDSELAATRVLRVPITEASANVRVGPPKDAGEDLSLPVWAGVVPLRLAAGDPQPDALMLEGIPLPDYLRPAAVTSRGGGPP